MILWSWSFNILPCHQDDDNSTHSGPSRLLRILISESAHLIWVLRCERTIQGLSHSTASIKSRWYNKINQCLDLDRHIATRYNRKPITRQLVLDTWQATLLERFPFLEDDWITNHEVLVGITLTRSPPWNGITSELTEPHTPCCKTGSASEHFSSDRTSHKMSALVFV